MRRKSEIKLLHSVKYELTLRVLLPLGGQETVP